MLSAHSMGQRGSGSRAVIVGESMSSSTTWNATRSAVPGDHMLPAPLCFPLGTLTTAPQRRRGHGQRLPKSHDEQRPARENTGDREVCPGNQRKLAKLVRLGIALTSLSGLGWWLLGGFFMGHTQHSGAGGAQQPQGSSQQCSDRALDRPGVRSTT